MNFFLAKISFLNYSMIFVNSVIVTMASASASASSRWSRLWTWLLRPSVWVALISIIAYWDDTALHGKFVYDDAGSVARNVVVSGKVPWTDVWKRDYWGTSMAEPASHKSFRPITTISFKLNYLYAGEDTYTYHVINVLLHGFVVLLVTEGSAFVFDGNTQADTIAQIVTGFLFGLHPVHTEAVSNITSRGEMLMSIFFLLAFISYASHLRQRSAPSKIRTFFCIYVLPFVCMTLSLFSKEQGATTLITLVVYDFLKYHTSVRQYAAALLSGDTDSLRFLGRTIILALQTLSVCGLRIWLNGESSPDFVTDQNPAGFATDRFTRIFSVNWVYCLYIRDAIYPKYLAPDWSGNSIDLIREDSDLRIVPVVALWLFAAACIRSLVSGPPNGASETHCEGRRILLTAFFAFLFSPFLLSSNLLVVVGLMKADRVIYLPLLGFCMMEALVLKLLACQPSKDKNNSSLAGSGAHWWGHLLLLVQLMYFATRVHERNYAWSHSLRLWESSYEINPKSYHTMYNYGYELSLVKQYKRAEKVMRPIGSARVDGPSNTFVYAIVLFNMHRCDEAHKLIDEAIEVIEERRIEGGPRNTPQSLARYESNLLVARATCTFDITEKGKILYQAVQADQTNDYAVQQATALMEQVQRMNAQLQ